MENQPPNEQEVEAALKEELTVRMGGADDVGHKALIDALSALFKEAWEYEYHDFKSSHSTPKAALVQNLEAMISNVKAGVYDN